MKNLIIRILENDLGKTELIIGTDVLKIPLSLVRYINKTLFDAYNEKKVVHHHLIHGKRSEAKMGYERSEYPISKSSYLHYDHRLRLGHSGLVNE